jgi:hypothetical protein
MTYKNLGFFALLLSVFGVRESCASGWQMNNSTGGINTFQYFGSPGVDQVINLYEADNSTITNFRLRNNATEVDDYKLTLVCKTYTDDNQSEQPIENYTSGTKTVTLYTTSTATTFKIKDLQIGDSLTPKTTSYSSATVPLLNVQTSSYASGLTTINGNFTITPGFSFSIKNPTTIAKLIIPALVG